MAAKISKIPFPLLALALGVALALGATIGGSSAERPVTAPSATVAPSSALLDISTLIDCEDWLDAAPPVCITYDTACGERDDSPHMEWLVRYPDGTCRSIRR